MDVARRKAEKKYWKIMGELVAGGMTLDQARDKMYQDLIGAGEVKAADELRRYQDIIHPVMKQRQSPPARNTETPGQNERNERFDHN